MKMKMIILTLTCRLPLRVTRRGIGKKLNKARTEYRHSRSRSTCDSCDRSSWISHLGDETYCRANSDNPAFHDVQRTLLSFCTCLLCSFVLRVRSFTMLSAGFFVFLQFLFPRFFFSVSPSLTRSTEYTQGVPDTIDWDWWFHVQRLVEKRGWSFLVKGPFKENFEFENLSSMAGILNGDK